MRTPWNKLYSFPVYSRLSSPIFSESLPERNVGILYIRPLVYRAELFSEDSAGRYGRTAIARGAEIGRILHGFGSIARLYVAVCIELLVFQPFIILTHNIDAFYGREDRIFIIYSRDRLNSRLNVAGSLY